MKSFRDIKHYKRPQSDGCRDRKVARTTSHADPAADAARAARQSDPGRTAIRQKDFGIWRPSAGTTITAARAMSSGLGLRRARPAGGRPCRRARREPHRMGAGADLSRGLSALSRSASSDQPGSEVALRRQSRRRRGDGVRGPGADRQGDRGVLDQSPALRDRGDGDQGPAQRRRRRARTSRPSPTWSGSGRARPPTATWSRSWPRSGSTTRADDLHWAPPARAAPWRPLAQHPRRRARIIDRPGLRTTPAPVLTCPATSPSRC